MSVFTLQNVKISIFSNNSCLISKIVVPLQPKDFRLRDILCGGDFHGHDPQRRSEK